MSEGSVQYTPRIPPPSFRPAFSQWVEKGYPLTKENRAFPDPCEVCGTAGQLCTHDQDTERRIAMANQSNKNKGGQKPKGGAKPKDQNTPEEQEGAAQQAASEAADQGKNDEGKSPLQIAQEEQEAAGHDEDGYPLNTDRPKPDNWNEMDDDEKRAYVYSPESPAVLAAGNTSGIEPADEDQKSLSEEYIDAQDQAHAEGRVKYGSPPQGEPEGIILDQNEPLRLEGEEVGGFLVLKEAHYRKVVPFRSKRPTYILLYAAGTQIPMGSVQRINEAADEAESED